MPRRASKSPEPARATAPLSVSRPRRISVATTEEKIRQSIKTESAKPGFRLQNGSTVSTSSGASTKSRGAAKELHPRELEFAQRTARKTLSWIALATALILGLASGHAELALTLPLPAPSLMRTIVAGLVFAVMLSTFLIELFWMPKARDPSLPGRTESDGVKWRIFQTPLGHLVWLTMQIIVFLNLVTLLWFLGEATLLMDPRVGKAAPASIGLGALVLSYQLAAVATGFAWLLAVLFTKLCFFEKKWRETVRDPYNATHSPHFGAVQLYIHCVQAPLCTLSYLGVWDRRLLLSVKPSLKKVLAGSIGYGNLYIGLLLAVYLGYATPVYPIIEVVHTAKPFPMGWIGFTGAISGVVAAFMCGIVYLI